METVIKQAKLFVGGISDTTTEETLTKHFCRYGEIVKSEVLRFETGCGRGFGFVTFVDSSVVDKVLQDQHIILGRTVDVKWARPKGEKSQSQQDIYHSKKIFVGGLPHDISKEDFRKYFETFGGIEDATILYNKETNKSRGFGFITYDSEETASSVLGFHMLNDRWVDVKKAKLREKRATNNFIDYRFHHSYTDFGSWPNYGMYTPAHWTDYNMMHRKASPSYYMGIDMSVSQPALMPCFIHRGPVNGCSPASYGGSNDGFSNASYNDLGHLAGRAHTSANSLENKEIIAGNSSLSNNEHEASSENAKASTSRSTMSLENEAINGGEDNYEKSLPVTERECEKDKDNNSSTSVSSMFGLANGKKDNITEIFQDNTEKDDGNNNCVSPNMLRSANGEKDNITGNSQASRK